MSNRSIRMTFPSRFGHELAARLDMPVAGARAYALFAHCFTCTKDIFAARRIAATLASLGVAVLRFDFTGLGSSEGEFQNTNFSSNVEDLVRAADHLREHYRAPAIVIGHSLGGAAVLAAAHRMPEAKAIVTIGAPFDVAHVLHHFQAQLDDIERDGIATVTLGGRTFPISKSLVRACATFILELGQGAEVPGINRRDGCVDRHVVVVVEIASVRRVPRERPTPASPCSARACRAARHRETTTRFVSRAAGNLRDNPSAGDLVGTRGATWDSLRPRHGSNMKCWTMSSTEAVEQVEPGSPCRAGRRRA